MKNDSISITSLVIEHEYSINFVTLQVQAALNHLQGEKIIKQKFAEDPNYEPEAPSASSRPSNSAIASPSSAPNSADPDRPKFSYYYVDYKQVNMIRRHNERLVTAR